MKILCPLMIKRLDINCFNNLANTKSNKFRQKLSSIFENAQNENFSTPLQLILKSLKQF